jgi:alpha-2-macroglobulin
VFESTPVTGQTKLQFGTVERTISWSQGAAAAPGGASAGTAAVNTASMPAATAATRSSTARSELLSWPSKGTNGESALTLTHDGTGKPWATIESLAAVPLKGPLAPGYRITRTVTPLDPALKGVYSRGDVVRVRLDIDAQTDMTWVVVNDPVPAGATILGSGLGRDSEAATQGENRSENAEQNAWPVFVERGFDGYRAYYDYLPKGKFWIEYTVRLNNIGTFGLPPTRVEALYAPSTFGALPNAPVVVQAAPATSSPASAAK